MSKIDVLDQTGKLLQSKSSPPLQGKGIYSLLVFIAWNKTQQQGDFFLHYYYENRTTSTLKQKSVQKAIPISFFLYFMY